MWYLQYLNTILGTTFNINVIICLRVEILRFNEFDWLIKGKAAITSAIKIYTPPPLTPKSHCLIALNNIHKTVLSLSYTIYSFSFILITLNRSSRTMLSTRGKNRTLSCSRDWFEWLQTQLNKSEWNCRFYEVVLSG